jgi:hypothetical protein
MFDPGPVLREKERKGRKGVVEDFAVGRVAGGATGGIGVRWWVGFMLDFSVVLWAYTGDGISYRTTA